jgi:hypothetical protein
MHNPGTEVPGYFPRVPTGRKIAKYQIAAHAPPFAATAVKGLEWATGKSEFRTSQALARRVATGESRKGVNAELPDNCGGT